MNDRTEFCRRKSLKLFGYAACVGVAAAFLPFASIASAQDAYPSRTVRMVIPFPAGGTSDIVGRVAAQELSKLWGQEVIVDNQPGATGAIGTKFVAESEPDGYTLVLANDSSQITNGLLNPPAAFDGIADFAPIASLVRGQLILLVHPSLPVNSVEELVAYAKEHPGEVNFGSSGIGSTPQIAAEMFKLAAGVDIVHVPYAGAAPAMVSLLSGETQMNFVSAAVATKEIISGESPLKPLATPSEQRWPQLPDVPTMAEAGYPDVIEESVFGLLAPAGTPSEVVDKINADLHTVLDTPEMQARLLELGYALALGSPADYATMLAETLERKKAVIESAHISAN